MSDCIYCTNPASDHGSGIDSHRFTSRQPEPTQFFHTRGPNFGEPIEADDVDTCTFCGHPVDHHGTSQVGCADCECGAEPDWHQPEPDRPNHWGDE